MAGSSSSAEPGEAIRDTAEVPVVGDGPQAEPAPNPSLSHGAAQEAKRNLKVRITGVSLEHPDMERHAYLLPGAPLVVRVSFEATELVHDAVVGVGVFDLADGTPLFGINTDQLGVALPRLDGPGEVVFEFSAVPLLDGTYPVTIGIHSQDEGTVYDWSEQRHWFTVMSPDRRSGKVAMDVKARFEAG
jgi:hypothetical protein